MTRCRWRMPRRLTFIMLEFWRNVLLACNRCMTRDLTIDMLQYGRDALQLICISLPTCCITRRVCWSPDEMSVLCLQLTHVSQLDLVFLDSCLHAQILTRCLNVWRYVSQFATVLACHVKICLSHAQVLSRRPNWQYVSQFTTAFCMLESCSISDESPRFWVGQHMSWGAFHTECLARKLSCTNVVSSIRLDETYKQSRAIVLHLRHANAGVTYQK